MEQYKKDFIDFLLNTGALKVFDNPADDRKLKSDRISPWFVNIGDFNDGESSNALAGFYADAIINSGVEGKVLYGIPDKGVGLAAPVAMAMAAKGHNIGWNFSRKDAKTHGEATNLGPEDKIKKLCVGRIPKVDDAIVQLDDVFTAGDAKYEANNFLKGLNRTNLPLLAIAVDRQEVAVDSKEAITEYQEKTGTKVVSVVNAVDILEYFKEIITSEEFKDKPVKSMAEGNRRVASYLRVYGTKGARDYVTSTILGKLEQTIIARERSVIPACDVSTIEQFEELVKQTANVEGIGGYKIGFEIALGSSKLSLGPLKALIEEANKYSEEAPEKLKPLLKQINAFVSGLPIELVLGGLERAVQTARKYTDKPIIYDHQKAGTDIPATGKNFARVCKKAGLDAVILFPQAGPETERAWIYYALDVGLNVIVGGRMTHKAYAQSEGGFITDEGALDMYRIAARAGITNFVAPGNKPAVIEQVKKVIEAEGIIDPILYSPGFIEQGGKITDAAKVAGSRYHAIVGTGIYTKNDMKAAAEEYTSQIKG